VFFLAVQIEIIDGLKKAGVNIAGQLAVSLGDPLINTIKYKKVSSGSTDVVWQPASGKSIQLASLIVSMDGIGYVEVLFDSDVKTRLDFNEKKVVPLPINYVVSVGVNKVLKVKASNSNAYVSVIGFEYSIE